MAAGVDRRGEGAAPSVLELLLRPEAPNVIKALPTARYRIKRLSEQCGADVVFTLRALPYGKVQQIKGAGGEDTSLLIVLGGVVEPDWKDRRLQERFGADNAPETVKAMLLSGEIEDLARAIELLSGYRRATIEEVKNVSGTAATEN